MDDIAVAFWVFAFAYVVAIPLILWLGMRWHGKECKLPSSLAFGLSAICAGLFLFAAFVALTPTHDRGMGIIILLLYPAIDALLVAAGLVAITVCGIKKAFGGRNGCERREPEGDSSEPYSLGE